MSSKPLDGAGTVAAMTSPYEVVTVDPDDDAAFADWFAVLHASQQEQRPGQVDDLPHEQQYAAREGRDGDGYWTTTLLAVRDAGGRTVACSRIDAPIRDNQHLVEISFDVHPEARRRGVGRLLAHAVEQRTRELGRTTVISYADEPPGQQGSSPGRLGAQALGMTVVQQEARRDLDLPLDRARVTALDAPATGYRVLTWWDRCPDEWLGERAELSRAMSTDIPKDDMDYREEAWDGNRVRRHEARIAAMDRTFVCGAAVHEASRTLVAYTEMGLPRSQPGRAFQWDTIVLQAHRGHRLGTLVKLAALRELRERSPGTEYVSTWNARENVHMIAVNDALGARVNGGLAILQAVLT